MFDSILGISNIPPPDYNQFSLSSTNTQSPSLGLKTGLEIQRIEKIELEKLYIANPIAFNCVSKYVYGVSKRPFKLESTTKTENKTLDKITKQTRMRSRVIPDLVKDMCVFGTGWRYLLPNQDGRILRLSERDPKFMDIAKSDEHGKPYPLLDDYEEPEYYVQYLEAFQQVPPEWKTKEIQQLGKRALRYEKYQILRANLFSIGDSFEGLGILEPMYIAGKNLNDVERATTQSILRLAYPIIYALVGDDRVYPTAQMIDETFEMMKEVNERTVFTLPSFVKPGILETKKPDQMTENLGYYVDQMVAASGLPKTLATGAGEGANKHTLAELMRFLAGSFFMIQLSLKEAFETQFLPVIKETENLQGELSFKWLDTELEDVSTKVQPSLVEPPNEEPDGIIPDGQPEDEDTPP